VIGAPVPVEGREREELIRQVRGFMLAALEAPPESGRDAMAEAM
jgi:hypothetical protein